MKPIISESVFKILTNLIRRKKTIEVKPLHEELSKALDSKR
jgi:hypothetical protein